MTLKHYFVNAKTSKAVRKANAGKRNLAYLSRIEEMQEREMEKELRLHLFKSKLK